MKVQPLVAALVAALLPMTHQHAAASVSKPVAEVIEQLAKLAGRAPERGAAEALEMAWRTNGRLALDAAERGGLGLTEAAARHGDDIMRLAVRVPEAAPILAARADEVLPLVREFGDDILRIEARVPGLADDAARSFPATGDLRRLAKLPDEELRGVISLASHATEPAAARTLLDAVEKQGGSVLTKLNSGQILAGGLSTAMVITAAGGAVSVVRSPDALARVGVAAVGKIGTPVGIAVGLLILVVALPTACRLARSLRRRSHRPWPRSRSQNQISE